MATFSDLYPEIIPQASGVPEPIADIHIRNATIEFCEQSLAYQADLTAIPLVDGTSKYALSGFPNPSDERVAMIISARHAERPMMPITRSQLDMSTRNWRIDKNNIVINYFEDGLNSIRVIPVPNAEAVAYGNVSVRAALSPIRTATVIGDELLERYHEVLMHGSLARIMSMAGRVWYNSGMAQYHLTEFLSGIAQAKADRIKEGTDVSMVATMVPFA